MELRLIQSDYTYADFSTSVSPAIELALERKEAPSTVFVNLFKEDSFTVGFFEDPQKSMDLDYCRSEDIVVRRRQNAGGPIWGPAGAAFLVLYLDTALPWIPLKTVQDTFSITLSAMAEVIKEMFTVPARYRPLNDIEVNGKKLVATSARLENKILTMRMLVNVRLGDTSILQDAIHVPPEKTQDKEVKDVGGRFTSLEAETGKAISEQDILELTKHTLSKIIGPELSLSSAYLTKLEEDYANQYQESYVRDEWFLANSEEVRFRNELTPDTVKTEGRHKAPAGLIRVTLLIRKNKIRDLIITGDFHPSPYSVIQEMENCIRGQECNERVIREELEDIFKRDGVEMAGMTVEDFLSAFRKAL